MHQPRHQILLLVKVLVVLHGVAARLVLQQLAHEQEELLHVGHARHGGLQLEHGLADGDRQPAQRGVLQQPHQPREGRHAQHFLQPKLLQRRDQQLHHLLLRQPIRHLPVRLQHPVAALEDSVDVLQVPWVHLRGKVEQRHVQVADVRLGHLGAAGADAGGGTDELLKGGHFLKAGAGGFRLRLGVLCQAVHEAAHDGVDADADVEVRAGGEQSVQRAQMELVGERLDHAVHEVLLRDVVLA
mmetsp:Transcript_26795/g.69466  ORF Transcript_26795/g.69466 Transcript_26795/m.69466 type:complete len:242 (-) Transcript_26795:867-1592(-)